MWHERVRGGDTLDGYPSLFLWAKDLRSPRPRFTGLVRLVMPRFTGLHLDMAHIKKAVRVLELHVALRFGTQALRAARNHPRCVKPASVNRVLVDESLK